MDGNFVYVLAGPSCTVKLQKYQITEDQIIDS
jgi:hypothetical protein